MITRKILLSDPEDLIYYQVKTLDGRLIEGEALPSASEDATAWAEVLARHQVVEACAPFGF